MNGNEGGQLLALNQEVPAKIEKGEPVTAPAVPKQCAGNSCDPTLESTVESFAWDTVKRVRWLAELAKKYPEKARNVARQILAWPVMTSMPSLSDEDASWHPALDLELGRDYPLETRSRSRLHFGSEMGLYLTRWIKRLHEFRLSVNFRPPEIPGQGKSDEGIIRHYWRAGDESEPCPDTIAVLQVALKLSPLTKATSHEWSKSLLVPLIMLSDAGTDETSCLEPVLQAIWRQKGVKSVGTFKSRLLSAVSQMVRDRARLA